MALLFSACCLQTSAEQKKIAEDAGTTDGGANFDGGDSFDGGSQHDGGTCFIDGGRVPSRTFNPEDTTLCCNPSRDPLAWSTAFVRTGSYSLTIGDNSATGALGRPLPFNDRGHLLGMGFEFPVFDPSSPVVRWFLQLDPSETPGSLGPSTVLPLAGYWRAAMGDMNNDGLSDLVLAGSPYTGSQDYTSEVWVRMRLPGGGLASPVSYLVNVPNFDQIGLADLDGDGALDLVLGTRDALITYRNTGDGTLVPLQRLLWPGSVFAVGDFNRDGRTDVLTVGGFGPQVLFGAGGGMLAQPSEVSDYYDPQAALFAGDFNGDGILDFVYAHDWSSVDLYFGLGDGQFRIASFAIGATNSIGVLTGDVNGDGVPDLLSQNVTAEGQLFLNRGDGTFIPQAFPPLSEDVGGLTPERAVLVDFNGDGALDVGTIYSRPDAGGVFEVWLNSCP